MRGSQSKRGNGNELPPPNARRLHHGLLRIGGIPLRRNRLLGIVHLSDREGDVISTKHTAGPWEIVVDGTCSAAWANIVPQGAVAEDINEMAIARLPTTHVERSTRGIPGSYSEKPARFVPAEDHDQVMANARLIAASPDLLAAHLEGERIISAFVGMTADGRLDCRNPAVIELCEIITAYQVAKDAAIAKATGESA